MELYLEPSRKKSVGRVDSMKGNKKNKLLQLSENMSLQNFENDLIVTEVTRKSEVLTIDLEKAGSVHLPKGAERFSYKPSFEYGIIYIPVNRLSLVYQTEKATNKKKVGILRKKMRSGITLDPVQIGYNYDVHDGHHRWTAAREEGYTHVPCEVVGNDASKVKIAKAKYREVWKSLENSYECLTPSSLCLVLDLQKSELHKGKLIRRRTMVKGKNGKTFYRMQWVDPHDDPQKTERTGKEESTYNHHEEGLKEMEARQSNRFPVMRMGVGDMKIDEYGYKPDKSAIAQAIHDYHNGDKLPPIRVTPKGKILNNYEMYEMAKQLGLSHIPVVVVGNTTEKKALEDKLKEEVLVEEEDEDGNTIRATISHSKAKDSEDDEKSLSSEIIGDIEHFKQFVSKKYPKQYIMEQAISQGIEWDSKTKEGSELSSNSAILWMRAHQSIVKHLKSGHTFDLIPDKKQVNKRMTQDSKDPMHKTFLQVFEKFKGDQQSLMEYMEKEGIAWKKSNDPSINWMHAVTSAKLHLAQGKMISGVRSRQKDIMDEANLVVSDQIKIQVKEIGNKHGKDAVMSRATELGIDFDRFNKKGEELSSNSNVLWMRAHVAISLYIAKGNKFQMSGAIEDSQGLTGEVGASKLNQWSQYALDHTIRNSERDEARTKKYAINCIKIDRGLDDEGAQEIYDKLMVNARKAKLMVMFDPFEKLPSGVNLMEQMSSDGSLKNNHILGRGHYDKENMESNEGDLYDNDYTYHVKTADRPIYGVLDLFNTGLNTGGGSNYHSGGVAFVMKEEVKNRSTGSSVDSNSIPYGEEGKWTKPLTDPHQLLVDRWYSKWKAPNKADGQRKRAMNAVIDGTTHTDDQRYFESQIHGGMDLKKDVDHILLPLSWKSDSAHKSHHTKIQEFASLHGISVKYE